MPRRCVVIIIIIAAAWGSLAQSACSTDEVWAAMTASRRRILKGIVDWMNERDVDGELSDGAGYGGSTAGVTALSIERLFCRD